MKKSLKSIVFIDILSAVIGGLAFLFLFFVLHITFIYSALMGVGTYIGLSLLLKPSKLKIRKIDISSLKDIENAEKTISDGYRKMDEISTYMNKIKNGTVRNKVEKIFHIANRVFEYIEKDPSKIRVAKRFFSYYLDTGTKLLNKYFELERSNSGIESNEINNALKKIEDVLDTVILAFEKQLTNLLENEIIDIESEISLLENTMKMEGF